MPLKDRMDLRYVYASVFISSTGLGLHIYFVPVFAQKLGASYVDLGMLGVAGSAAYAIAPLIIGYMADRFNRALIFTLGLAINALAAGAFTLARSVPEVILIRAVGGVAFSFFWPAAEILISDMVPANMRVGAMGRYSVSWATGLLIGPFIGGFLLEGYGFAALFLASALAVSAGLVPASWKMMPRYGRAARSSEPRVKTSPAMPSGMLPIYAVVVPYAFVFGVIVHIFPGYANQLGIGPTNIGLLFTIFGLARIASFSRSDFFSRLGERRALTMAFTALIVAFLTIAYVRNAPGLALAMGIIGAAFGIIFPLTVTLASRGASHERLGLAIGVYESIFGAGFTAGPLIAGFVAELLGAASPFQLSAALAMSMIVLMTRWKADRGLRYGA